MNISSFLFEHPEIIVTILSGFLLPIILVWLNNRYNLKAKTKEQEIQQKFNFRNAQISHEKIIHSSLVKILFEIQKLYVSLSCDPDKDGTCIDRASSNFLICFSSYQGIISDNQIFLKSNIVNEIYKFYNVIAEILIEINEINSVGKAELAKVCVYDRSQELAKIILNIQEVFISKRKKLFGDLQIVREELKEFETCCGPPPPIELRMRYTQVKNEIDKTPGTILKPDVQEIASI